MSPPTQPRQRMTVPHEGAGDREQVTERRMRATLSRAALQYHGKDPTPFARETDPNREFARLDHNRSAMWFFGTLPIFIIIIYVICVRLGAI